MERFQAEEIAVAKSLWWECACWPHVEGSRRPALLEGVREKRGQEWGWGRARSQSPKPGGAYELQKAVRIWAQDFCSQVEGSLHCAMLPLQEVIMGLPWRSSDWDTAHPMQGPWVQSLVRELRSHMPCGEANKKKSRKRESGFEDQQKWCFGLCMFFPSVCLQTNQQSEWKLCTRSKIQRTKLPNTFLSLHRLNKLHIPSSEFIQPTRRVESAIKKHPEPLGWGGSCCLQGLGLHLVVAFSYGWTMSTPKSICSSPTANMTLLGDRTWRR